MSVLTYNYKVVYSQNVWNRSATPDGTSLELNLPSAFSNNSTTSPVMLNESGENIERMNRRFVGVNSSVDTLPSIDIFPSQFRESAPNDLTKADIARVNASHVIPSSFNAMNPSIPTNEKTTPSRYRMNNVSTECLGHDSTNGSPFSNRKSPIRYSIPDNSLIPVVPASPSNLYPRYNDLYDNSMDNESKNNESSGTKPSRSSVQGVLLENNQVLLLNYDIFADKSTEQQEQFIIHERNEGNMIQLEEYTRYISDMYNMNRSSVAGDYLVSMDDFFGLSAREKLNMIKSHTFMKSSSQSFEHRNNRHVNGLTQNDRNYTSRRQTDGMQIRSDGDSPMHHGHSPTKGVLDSKSNQVTNSADNGADTKMTRNDHTGWSSRPDKYSACDKVSDVSNLNKYSKNKRINKENTNANFASSHRQAQGHLNTDAGDAAGDDVNGDYSDGGSLDSISDSIAPLSHEASERFFLTKVSAASYPVVRPITSPSLVSVPIKSVGVNTKLPSSHNRFDEVSRKVLTSAGRTGVVLSDCVVNGEDSDVKLQGVTIDLRHSSNALMDLYNHYKDDLSDMQKIQLYQISVRDWNNASSVTIIQMFHDMLPQLEDLFNTGKKYLAKINKAEMVSNELIAQSKSGKSSPAVSMCGMNELSR